MLAAAPAAAECLRVGMDAEAVAALVHQRRRAVVQAAPLLAVEADRPLPVLAAVPEECPEAFPPEAAVVASADRQPAAAPAERRTEGFPPGRRHDRPRS